MLIINAFAKGEFISENLSDCDDTRVMIKALNGDEKVIDIMAAGTAMRFLTAYYSVIPGTRIITGTERMRKRPIRILVNALRDLGAQIAYTGDEGFPPLQITGTDLTGSAISLKGDVSSQYISALLMIAPILKNGLQLHLTGEIISRPYIRLTLKLMKDFGVEASWDSQADISVHPQSYLSVPFTVESDWSAASYWYQIAALSEQAEIELPGLLPNSYQGDSRVAEIFYRLGVETIFDSKGVTLRKRNTYVERLDESFIDIPDLAQTFAVTCALLNIPFRFSGLQSLKIKETDRMAALIAELGKLGFLLREEEGSVLIWDGKMQETLSSPIIQTYEDHRMAMAFAPAAIRRPNIRIANPDVVSKSYPAFWKDLEKAGVVITKEI
ncbi:3-phosphoshikimate 1-carboxyvinyltransferase [termite gut metagenome]|uniref:3-phosphoshikimate 1-carboxyvinyltransferase n=1 Tax=termite gut metagenome TaxID=433724 RepID=A0A5J4T1U1_9ZZZZ